MIDLPLASNTKLEAERVFPEIVYPAILPPVNNTSEPLTWPSSFTLNTAEPVPAFKLAAPAKNLASPTADIPVYVPSVNLFIVFGAIVQFAIKPSEAVRIPSIFAPLAINVPLEETAKSVPNLT